MFRAELRFLCLFSVACAATPSQELYSWNAAEVSVPLSPAWELTLHTRIRTRDEFHHVAQIRGGPQIGYRYQRFSFRGAYYYEPNHPSRFDSPGAAGWESGHRVFGAADATLRPARKFTLAPRFPWERFFTQNQGQFNRYRTGARVEAGRGTGPYFQHEWMFVASGLQTLRNGAGMRFAVGHRWSMEAGWLFDRRPESWGGNRQAVVSTVRYAWGE